MNAADIITGILQREGAAYTNRPGDRGGPTKYGVTQAALSKWLGRPATIPEVQDLSEATARQIYEARYVKPWATLAHQRLQVQCIDWSVTSGQDDPTRALQLLLGLRQDGILGPQTLAAANAKADDHFANLFACERAKFYGRIVHDDASQRVNINGWLSRALSFVQ